nr:uncharacterized protein LOC113460126 isoform X1 [Zonotrichia albicollis]
MCWEFLNGTGPQPILQHQGGPHAPAIHAPYAGRAVFHPSNGSLLLQDAQESDSGTYRVTANTGDRKSLEVQLEVLQPVSRPQLRTSSLLARATGQVICEVAEGRVDTIAWKKDGQPLLPDRVSQLSSSCSVLYLRPAKKSDCGSYSCNASNGISWQETSLEVTIEGLSSHLKHILRMAVIAVVFAAVAAWGLIIPVCQSERLRISELGGVGPHFPCLVGESKKHCPGNPQILGYPTASGWGWAAPHHEEGVMADTGFPGLTAVTPLCSGFSGGELWRWLSSYTCGLVCIACILDGTAGILWMWEEGPSLAVILPEITLSYLSVVNFLGATAVIFQPTHFSRLKSKKEEGCTEFVDVTILVSSAVAVSVLPLLAIVLCYLSFARHTVQGCSNDCDVSWMGKTRSFEMSQPGTKDTNPS